MFKEDRFKIAFLLLLPFLLVAIAYITGKSITIEPSLSSSEKAILNYHSNITKLPDAQILQFVRKQDPFQYVFIKIQRPSEKYAVSTVKETKRRKESFKLSLIIIGKKRSFAVLNGLTVKEGDRFDGYIVKAILPDKVILYSKDTKRTIYLEE